MKSLSFQDAYCAGAQLSSVEFAEVVMRRTLYPHAWLFRPVLVFFNPQYFAADYDFVHAVGRIRRVRDFAGEASDFTHHPANVGLLRRTLRMRVSSARLRKLVRATFVGHRELPGNDENGTAVPFALPAAETPSSNKPATS